MRLPSLTANALCAAGLLAAAVALASAQAPRRDGTTAASVIPDEPLCRTCAIRLRRVALLGDADGAGSFTNYPLSVQRDRLGRYWVVTGTDLPMVFDSLGRFLRVVGGRGRGPEEFVTAMDLAVLPGDSILIIDSGQRRASVVGPDFRPARVVLIPMSSRPTLPVSWPHDVWMNGALPTPQSAGWPIHRVSFASSPATLRESLGPGDGALRRGFDFIWQWMTQTTASGVTNAVWTADRMQYRLTEWTREGERVQSFVRHPEWFPAQAAASMGNSTTPPATVVGAIHADTSGLLWVFVNTPSPGWQDAWRMRPPEAIVHGEVTLRGLAMERLWGTTVEVIDPLARRVVARQVMDEWVVAVTADRRAIAVVSDPEGILRLAVIEVVLDRR